MPHFSKIKCIVHTPLVHIGMVEKKKSSTSEITISLS
jgi:hypothetical protein